MKDDIEEKAEELQKKLLPQKEETYKVFEYFSNNIPLLWLCSEFSVNARFHDKTVHILRSSEPEAEAEPPPMAARSVLDRLA